MFFDFSDITLVLFAVICIWLALNYTGGTGGGHRVQVPTA